MNQIKRNKYEIKIFETIQRIKSGISGSSDEFLGLEELNKLVDDLNFRLKNWTLELKRFNYYDACVKYLILAAIGEAKIYQKELEQKISLQEKV